MQFLSTPLNKMRDEAIRQKIRESLIQHSSEVGLGLRCPHCGAPTGGDWMSDIRNAFDPNKNGLNRSIEDTKRKIDDSNAKIRNEFENPDSLLRQGVGKFTNELVNDDSDFRKKILPQIEKGVDSVGRVIGIGKKIVGMGLDEKKKKGSWSPEAKARARARASNPHSHASKVKAYMKKHKSASLAEASRAVSQK